MKKAETHYVLSSFHFVFRLRFLPCDNIVGYYRVRYTMVLRRAPLHRITLYAWHGGVLCVHAFNSPVYTMDVLRTVPPKIMPIQAMTDVLREGMRAAISCQILEGDLPVSFRWERNGKPLLGTG